MTASKIQKRTLASAIAITLGVCATPQISVADITLTFRDNTTPSATPLPFSGPSANLPFAPSGGVNTEFRVVTPLGNNRNDGQKDAIFGGETWTYDVAGELIGTGNVDVLGNPGTCNPNVLCKSPMTSGLAGFPICSTAGDADCPVQEQGADFLSAGDFNFIAPVKGSIVETTYGVGTVVINLTNNTLISHFPVTHAQWANGNYIIGADPDPSPTANGDRFVKGAGPGVNISDAGGITVTSAPGAADLTFDFIMHGESRMSLDEVTVPGFNQNAVQWELPGTATVNNQNPVAVDDGTGTAIPAVSGAATAVDVLANDTDPDHALLGSAAFDTLAVDGVGACTNGTLTNNTTDVTYQSVALFTGAASCTYTIRDGRTGVSTAATVMLDVVSAGVNTPPTGNPDGPGGNFQTNQGLAVSVDVLANDSDAQMDAFTVSRVDATSVSGGTVAIINGGVQGGNNVMYTPASGFNGLDSFTYDVTDVNTATTAGVTVQMQVDVFSESSAGTVAVSAPRTAASIPVVDPDTVSSCQGGCFDITLTGVPMGGQVEVLLPKLSTAYVDGAELRHFVVSTQLWKAHDAPDGVQTAPEDGGTGLCPGLASPNWRAPTAGDTCAKYTITDNGTNDDDLTLGTIVDPVGFGQPPAAAIDLSDVISSTGCSLGGDSSNVTWRDSGHWLIVGAFIALLRLTRRRKVGGAFIN